MQHIVDSDIMDHLEVGNLLSDRQHAYRRKHSRETQLVISLYNWAQI